MGSFKPPRGSGEPQRAGALGGSLGEGGMFSCSLMLGDLGLTLERTEDVAARCWLFVLMLLSGDRNAARGPAGVDGCTPVEPTAAAMPAPRERGR